jgi:hypothetical protein
VSLTEYAERARRGEPKTVAADSRRLQAKFRQSLIMLKEGTGEGRGGEERSQVRMTSKMMVEGEISYCCKGARYNVETVLLVFNTKQWGGLRSEQQNGE